MAFKFKLELEDGPPADVLDTALPNWSAGDTIPLSAERTLRGVEIRPASADENPVLVVEAA